ncbi:sigma-70 family RNA polymerase sigma factor [Bradyrhizobium sp. ISRA443]|uniref:sigma-70 family RNA polymerase sigma factor n=1 Tax=unclassified Bradyrhizobium TaxID=2631580 RepID=UPI002478AA2F|nr:MULTISPECIES: sigma-70 family RNA polymerase sigma factor [unclassified Bradyrhizobium]WGS00082.1 sigma-70 family RNA polymerase sigma factor [Bradyrhizobium sp. ISRA436]WGS06971.1 sigma-70 family RNA polymerase sigma factor [Bradyrhizobium sp. ISRA437]WGS13853.1 sigma-70 family RNA polymerase sigma factor [Bradyrhizobium sp. ISRA443]
MDDKKFLAEQFEASRPRLRAVAYRMLGSTAEVDDAVQETWLRLSRTDAATVDNLSGFLTTVISRICLDMLRSRKSRREEPMGPQVPEPVADNDSEREAEMADSVGAALLVVLETLAPAERLAFVLHDMFAVPFEEIAPIVGRTPAAARQLASRARRRVRGTPHALDVDLSRQRGIVEAFLAASRNGDFEGLLAVLDPDVVVRADQAAQRLGSLPEIRGAVAVAEAFKGRAQAARPALVDGEIGAAVILGGQLRIVLRITIADDRIAAIDAVAEAGEIETFDVEVFDRA